MLIANLFQGCQTHLTQASPSAAWSTSKRSSRILDIVVRRTPYQWVEKKAAYSGFTTSCFTTLISQQRQQIVYDFKDEMCRKIDELQFVFFRILLSLYITELCLFER